MQQASMLGMIVFWKLSYFGYAHDVFIYVLIYI